MTLAISDQRPRIKYETAVTKGKRIAQDLEHAQSRLWDLGDLADRIEPKYGDQTLEKFSQAIGIPYKTILKCRTTARAWPEISRRREFSIACELNAHPDRIGIVQRHKNRHRKEITQAEARKEMKEWREENPRRQVHTAGTMAEKLIKKFDEWCKLHDKLHANIKVVIDMTGELERPTKRKLEEAMTNAIKRQQKLLDELKGAQGGTVIDLTARRIS